MYLLHAFKNVEQSWKTTIVQMLYEMYMELSIYRFTLCLFFRVSIQNLDPYALIVSVSPTPSTPWISLLQKHRLLKTHQIAYGNNTVHFKDHICVLKIKKHNIKAGLPSAPGISMIRKAVKHLLPSAWLLFSIVIQFLF